MGNKADYVRRRKGKKRLAQQRASNMINVKRRRLAEESENVPCEEVIGGEDFVAELQNVDPRTICNDPFDSLINDLGNTHGQSKENHAVNDQYLNTDWILNSLSAAVNNSTAGDPSIAETVSHCQDKDSADTSIEDVEININVTPQIDRGSGSETPTNNGNDCPDLQMETAVYTNEDEAMSKFEGRRLIDVNHFFLKIKEVAVHGFMDCGLGCVEIVGETRHGLKSKFKLQCKMCNEKFFVGNEADKEFSVNDSAVAGTIAIGCGHSQLQELSAALDLPLITPNTYSQCHCRISSQWEKISLDTMKEAAERERKLAFAEGRIDKNGIAIIDVIVDGCWCKRTYKKNYSALSGAAAIIGKRTGEVLYLGVKNKYCTLCAHTEKKRIQPKKHACYKNYTASSTGMESAIITEGFRCSIEMHNLIYGRFISDGDASTHSKLLSSRPYPDITIEKIECRNHLLRNLCNKLEQLRNDTKYLLVHRKQLTQKKIMILRKTIREVIKLHKTDTESERKCHIEPLYNDIQIAHLHAFGNHSRCKRSFCSNDDKSETDHMDQSFFTSTLWSRICFLVSNLASQAPSLVHDVDSNTVERFNSIIAKMVGGKRINYSLKGSYQTRCHAAVVSFNTHKVISTLHKSITGRSPRGTIKLLEKRRIKRMTKARKYLRKKNRRLFAKGQDECYGDQCEKPDLANDMFEKKKETFLNSLQHTDTERENIQKLTVLQSSCSEWLELRRKLLTASNFGKVIKRRHDISCANLVKNILYKGSLSHVQSVNHGKENEKKAIEQLEEQERIKINPCGLFIDKEIPYLGATPDGLVGDDMIVEIKCPITAYKHGLQQAIDQKRIPFYTKSGNKLQINKNHDWYYQVQGQLHITTRTKCLFGLWYDEKAALKTEIIYKDDIFWENKMKDKLTTFYLNCILPELIDPRHTRKMTIRDPDYIMQAIEEKNKKVKKIKNVKKPNKGVKEKCN